MSLLPRREVLDRNQRQSYVERVFVQVNARPNAMAICDDQQNTSMTFRQFWDASSAMVTRIQEYAAGTPRVALIMERSWQHQTVILATQRLGGTCVLIGPDQPDERIAEFLDTCKPDVMVVAGATTKRLPSQSRIVMDGLTSLLAERGEVDQSTKLSNSDIAFIAGTSGSTGAPKAVCLSYTGMAATIDAIIDSAVLTPVTRGSWLTSPGYGMVEVDPIPVLAAGGTVYIPFLTTAQDVTQLAHWFSECDVTHTLMMTSLAEAFWAIAPNLPLKTMLIAGERCKRWPPCELGYQVLNVYGSAEAAVVSIEDLTAQRRTATPSVGRAVSGSNMYVVDANGHETPANTVGELVITRETLSHGYLDPDQTKKSFQSNKMDDSSSLQYCTGDRARMRVDGTVEVFGRNDGMVKVRGHRVDLAEIEIAAREVPGVAKAAVKFLDTDGGGSLALFIETVSAVQDFENGFCRNFFSFRLFLVIAIAEEKASGPNGD